MHRVYLISFLMAGYILQDGLLPKFRTGGKAEPKHKKTYHESTKRRRRQILGVFLLHPFYLLSLSCFRDRLKGPQNVHGVRKIDFLPLHHN